MLLADVISDGTIWPQTFTLITADMVIPMDLHDCYQVPFVSG